MKNYQKKVVETKVLKFYSTMQNAIRMSINENGPFETWIEEGVNNLDYEKNKAHLEKYILPYLKYEEVFEGDRRGRPIVKLSDGSYFRFNAESAAQLGWNTNLVSFVFFTDLKDTINCTPRNCFVFDTDKTLYIKPYDREWNNDRNKLMNNATWGCKKGFYNGSQNGLYCAKLLQLNGWKFPDDYPW